jgi:excisionase family DNA binding protein
MEAWLDVSEAAQLLNVSRSRVYQYIEGGQLPAVKKGGAYLLRRADVERFKQLPEGRAGHPRKLKRRGT